MVTERDAHETSRQLEELRRRYFAAAHAMQAGVAMEMNDPERQSATEPKHLRVGLNCAMSDHGALVRLLLAKGLITDLEYREALVEGMEREKASYEQRLSEKLGSKVTLG